MASRRCPASWRIRSRLTSLTEDVSQVLAGEGEKVEVLVPRAGAEVIEKFAVPDQKYLPLERVIPEGQRCVVEDAHVNGLPETEVQRHGEVERVPSAVITPDPARIEPHGDVDVSVWSTGQNGAVQAGEHDLRPRFQVMPERCDERPTVLGRHRSILAPEAASDADA
jgi:hypothetical protein